MQYYVYCERGYDTVPPRIHPERLNAVRVAIAEMSENEFEQYFGDLYQQLRSYEDSSIDRVIEIPSAAKDAESVLYRKNAYLAAIGLLDVAEPGRNQSGELARSGETVDRSRSRPDRLLPGLRRSD